VVKLEYRVTESFTLPVTWSLDPRLSQFLNRARFVVSIRTVEERSFRSVQVDTCCCAALGGEVAQKL